VTTIAPGSGYVFRPTASDVDGDSLTFAIQNKPAWAMFNVSTGMLTGVPASSDLGIFANIVISVSDGVAVTALPAFSIAVASGTASTTPTPPAPTAPAPPAAGTGTATLSWTAPTQNADGTSLTDLAGFRVYYGPNPTDLSLRQTLFDPQAVQAAVSGLSSGTWYFAVSAFNSAGAESALSNTRSKTIP
jgi:hypothetical protein